MAKNGKNFTSRPTPKEIPQNNQGTKPSAEGGMTDNTGNCDSSKFTNSGNSTTKPVKEPTEPKGDY